MSTSVASDPVNTKHVRERRTVHYESFDDLLADAQRLIDGGYRMVGNWGLGRILGHLSAIMEVALDGAPYRAPWPIRLVAKHVIKPMWRGFTRPMPAGFKMPAKAAAVLVPDDVPPEVALARLRRAIERWPHQATLHPHPVFDRMTRDEWVKVQLRHAEMHMSFALPA